MTRAELALKAAIDEVEKTMKRALATTTRQQQEEAFEELKNEFKDDLPNWYDDWRLDNGE